ncbi:hypothetical protein MXD81_57230 [Microbacteriaceae bacterium K1510]|nr:hypothetical protein [Microbacteriaceae bacterium K1510]
MARARRRLTGWLALFALALQLVVGFAHVHSEDFAGLLHPGVVRADPADFIPAGPSDPDHLTCDICAAVHLTGTSAMPTPPVLAVPVATTVDAPVATPTAYAPALVAAFDARGPPQA